MTNWKITIVCHGNIVRSQILHRYLAHVLESRNVQVDLFSCGIAPVEAYPHAEAMLQDVQRTLNQRGLTVALKRTAWSSEAARRVAESDLVLVADSGIRAEILSRVGVAPGKVISFYEFIGEGPRDYVDTYDPDQRRQDAERYQQAFDELERIAIIAADRITVMMT